MLKGETVYLRMLEPEDWEKTYIWHNDVDLQRLTCGPIPIVSKEIEKAWVNSKSSNNRNDLYLAICMNDNDRMIGFLSASSFKSEFRSCHWSGVLIGDKDAHSGIEYIEAVSLFLAYLFNEKNMHRVEASALKEHITSSAGIMAFGFEIEGLAKEAIFKEGKYHDRYDFALLEDKYRELRDSDGYEFSNVMQRMIIASKELKSKQ